MNPLPFNDQSSTVYFALKITFVVASWLSATSRVAMAHGEDRPGPHGGFIRMPGAFHTEIQKLGDSSFKVYLLDVEWKNPTTEKSSVSLSHKPNEGTADAPSTKAVCENKKTFFVCTFPKAVNLKNAGNLVLVAERQGLNGIPVNYALPLRLTSPHHEH